VSIGPCWAATAQAKARSLRPFAATFGRYGEKESAFYRLGPVERATAVAARNRISLVSPELHDRYLQQEWHLTGLQVLYSGFRTAITLTTKPKRRTKTLCGRNRRLAGHAPFAPPQCPAAFNGRITKNSSLLARWSREPVLLALDEVCDGLDAPSRTALLKMLGHLPQTGTQLIFATHRREEDLSRYHSHPGAGKRSNRQKLSERGLLTRSNVTPGAQERLSRQSRGII